MLERGQPCCLCSGKWDLPTPKSRDLSSGVSHGHRHISTSKPNGPGSHAKEAGGDGVWERALLGSALVQVMGAIHSADCLPRQISPCGQISYPAPILNPNQLTSSFF